jgi:hypothetical protein
VQGSFVSTGSPACRGCWFLWTDGENGEMDGAQPPGPQPFTATSPRSAPAELRAIIAPQLPQSRRDALRRKLPWRHKVQSRREVPLLGFRCVGDVTRHFIPGLAGLISQLPIGSSNRFPPCSLPPPSCCTERSQSPVSYPSSAAQLAGCLPQVLGPRPGRILPWQAASWPDSLSPSHLGQCWANGNTSPLWLV